MIWPSCAPDNNDIWCFVVSKKMVANGGFGRRGGVERECCVSFEVEKKYGHMYMQDGRATIGLRNNLGTG